jgi:hypothetical protein
MKIHLKKIKHIMCSSKTSNFRLASVCVLLFALGAPVSSNAQVATSIATRSDDLAALLSRSRSIAPMNNDVFGEGINYQTGSVVFSQVDVLLPGHGPEISLRRKFDVGSSRYRLMNRLAADWDIEIPKLSMKLPMDHHLMTAGTNYYTGAAHAQWAVRGSTPYARCTQYGLPPDIWLSGAQYPMAAQHWWQGASLYIPGKSVQQVMARAPQNPVSPNMVLSGESVN